MRTVNIGEVGERSRPPAVISNGELLNSPTELMVQPTRFHFDVTHGVIAFGQVGRLAVDPVAFVFQNGQQQIRIGRVFQGDQLDDLSAAVIAFAQAFYVGTQVTAGP
ncbi:hypothetical protein SDC9_177009 [bioreactor metagenome]|uniref:Uncharacterized protein n=1 Tax=bioreactor metagenome TaxID=1076179 RepID=A0A645GTL6_9ZZZZ